MAVVLLLYAVPLLRPVLAQDDFQILSQSWTWQRTLDGLLAPNNEHAMPLGRLLTFAVVRLADRPTALPFAGVLTGVLALLIAMALAGAFVRRELGHPFYGLVALILFGVSAVYQQAVYWFAACFSVYALVFLLLALLAAQRYRFTGQWGWLAACVAACALAPCWFASGVLAGPLCCLYLLPTEREGRRGAWGWLLRSTPLLGTAAFLAVVLPFTLPIIQNLERYRVDGTTALAAFRPLTGAWNTMRSIVDNLGLGAVGVSGVTTGSLLAPPLLALLAAAGVWWARRSPRRRLALLGGGLILCSYLLIYSGRAKWDYDGYPAAELHWQLLPALADIHRSSFFTPTWSRYHLQPQLGLVLLVCGGLPAWEGRWFRLDATGRLTAGQTGALALLLGVCLLTQAPRGVFCYYPPNPRQAETLARIERVDAFCREHHISGDAARRELGVLDMWGESVTRVNGWDFLRGSDRPNDPSQDVIGELRAESATGPSAR